MKYGIGQSSLALAMNKCGLRSSKWGHSSVQSVYI